MDFILCTVGDVVGSSVKKRDVDK